MFTCIRAALLISSVSVLPLSLPVVLAQGVLGPSDPSARIYDTGVRSPRSISGMKASSSADWERLEEDDTEHRFAGDAVISNGRLWIVLRRGGRGAEVYTRGAGEFTLRAQLRPVGADPRARLDSVRITDNSSGEVSVDAKWGSVDITEASFGLSLPAGRPFVKTEARDGLEAIAVEAPCRFTVLPDFFADDIVVDAAEIPVDQAELPCENLVLHMAGESDAIVMTVSNDRRQDLRVRLSGDGAERRFDRSEIAYGPDGKVWIAVLEGRDIWHRHEVGADDAGRTVDLHWSIPFPAQWRVDFRRDDRLTGSWEMVTERPDGRFDKHGWFGHPTSLPKDRQRWTTVLGRFKYPCWTDTAGRGHFEPLARKFCFQGPALIYPINRVKETPLDRFTVVDLVRATLGVGPCEYILDVEGQGQAYVGRATCGTRDLINPIYAAGRQKEETEKIEGALVDVLAFVKHIRGRIEDYVDFANQLVDYLDRQNKDHPELAEFIHEMESLARTIDERYAERRPEMRTPEYVAGLTDKFRRELLHYEGPDALDRCKEITGAIVQVGNNQDELVGECRMAVKLIRQRAGLAMAVDPRTAEIAREIRRRTQLILRNPTTYEAPRH